MPIANISGRFIEGSGANADSNSALTLRSQFGHVCGDGVCPAGTDCLASASADDPKENIDWPSPDGKFAFLTAHGEDLRPDRQEIQENYNGLARKIEPYLLACTLGARFESLRIDD